MNGRIVKLSDEQEAMLHAMGNCIDNKWYFIPCWFELKEDGTYAVYNLDSLPEHLKKRIEDNRNLKSNDNDKSRSDS